MEKKKLILGIDFNNVMYSSYFSDPLINNQGVNVNAVRTFFFRLRSWKDLFNPDYIVIASDVSRERTFRRKLYKAYKATRKVTDPDIVNQFGIANRVAALLGFPFINNELYEADDILGMLSLYASDHDIDIILVSSDKDLYQLMSDNVFILSPRTNELLDAGWLDEKYGVTPAQWIDMKMLMGDKGDNIPGIDGVGEVTALHLLHDFNNIDGIYKHLGYLKPKLRDILKAGYDDLPLTRELVTIVTDYSKIDLTQQMIDNQGRYESDLYEALDELGLRSLNDIMKYSLLLDKRGDDNDAKKSIDTSD